MKEIVLNIPAPPRPWEMFLAPPIVAEQGGGEGRAERMRSGEWVEQSKVEVWDAIDCGGATTQGDFSIRQRKKRR